jgi:hypothetical protein
MSENSYARGARQEIERMKGELDNLRAQNQALREALEAVEWVYSYSLGWPCVFCGSTRNWGHNPTCKVGNALKLARG